MKVHNTYRHQSSHTSFCIDHIHLDDGICQNYDGSAVKDNRVKSRFVDSGKLRVCGKHRLEKSAKVASNWFSRKYIK